MRGCRLRTGSHAFANPGLPVLSDVWHVPMLSGVSLQQPSTARAGLYLTSCLGCPAATKVCGAGRQHSMYCRYLKLLQSGAHEAKLDQVYTAWLDSMACVPNKERGDDYYTAPDGSQVKVAAVLLILLNNPKRPSW